MSVSAVGQTNQLPQSTASARQNGNTGNQVPVGSGAAAAPASHEDTDDAAEELTENAPEQRDRLLQSNGFLVEEAYLQERGELQHTVSFSRMRGASWHSSLAQEYPLRSDKHQLSFSLPSRLQKTGEHGGGVGDVEVAYSYGLVGSGTSRAAVAPTVALLLPTGSVEKEMGTGGFGAELMLPVSLMLHRRFAAHSNAGLGFTPRARNAEDEVVRLREYKLGQSLVWLARPRFNLLVEAVWERSIAREAGGEDEREDELFVSPGVRWGHEFKSGAKLVPGVAFPVGVGTSSGQRGVLFYLAFEHNVGRRSRVEDDR